MYVYVCILMCVCVYDVKCTSMYVCMYVCVCMCVCSYYEHSSTNVNNCNNIARHFNCIVYTLH